MSNIKDVAKKAGVSISTVSRVLTSSAPVSPELSARVRAIARELNYEPNPIARALVSKETKTIAVVVPLGRGSYSIGLLRGMEQILFKNGYDILLYNVDDEDDLSSVLGRMARDGRIDGVVYSSINVEEQHVQEMRRKSRPVILVNSIIPGYNCISINNKDGAKRAADHLIDRGHTRIALIGDANSNEDWTGFCEEMAAHKITKGEELVIAAEDSFLGGRTALQTLLKKNVYFTAVFTSTNAQALGVISTLKEEGITIPEEIAVISLGESDMAKTAGLTTIAPDASYMGKLAGRWMLLSLKGRRAGIKQRMILPELVIRKTT